MNCGELLTRVSVWLALFAYAAATGLMLTRHVGIRTRHEHLARAFWTVGCALFVVHVLSAFACFHGWSHRSAWEETARQTAEMTGLRSGAGLYLNYLFASLWFADVCWMWLRPGSHAGRPRSLHRGLHGFMFFMVLNGAVIFARAPMRWLGLAICGSVTAFWLKSLRDRSLVAPSPNR